MKRTAAAALVTICCLAGCGDVTAGTAPATTSSRTATFAEIRSAVKLPQGMKSAILDAPRRRVLVVTLAGSSSGDRLYLSAISTTTWATTNFLMSPPDSSAYDGVPVLSLAPDGSLWVGAGRTVIRVDPDNGSALATFSVPTRLSPPPPSDSTRGNIVAITQVDGTTELLLDGESQLLGIHQGKGTKLADLPIRGWPVSSIAVAADGAQLISGAVGDVRSERPSVAVWHGGPSRASVAPATHCWSGRESQPVCLSTKRRLSEYGRSSGAQTTFSFTPSQLRLSAIDSRGHVWSWVQAVGRAELVRQDVATGHTEADAFTLQHVGAGYLHSRTGGDGAPDHLSDIVPTISPGIQAIVPVTTSSAIVFTLAGTVNGVEPPISYGVSRYAPAYVAQLP